jgi:hypothetical protein
MAPPSVPDRDDSSTMRGMLKQLVPVAVDISEAGDSDSDCAGSVESVAESAVVPDAKSTERGSLLGRGALASRPRLESDPFSHSSPSLGRIQKLGVRPVDGKARTYRANCFFKKKKKKKELFSCFIFVLSGDVTARRYLVDGVEMTMPMSAMACPLCNCKFDEEGSAAPEKKLLHSKVKCTTCLRMVCSSCSRLVKLESYGESESRKLCHACLEDVKKKISQFKAVGRGTGLSMPPDERKSVSAPWSPGFVAICWLQWCLCEFVAFSFARDPF